MIAAVVLVKRAMAAASALRTHMGGDLSWASDIDAGKAVDRHAHVPDEDKNEVNPLRSQPSIDGLQIVNARLYVPYG